MTEATTPLMRQYTAIKKEHPPRCSSSGCGDFYELFFEDAVVASRSCRSRSLPATRKKGSPCPMCGVPYHAAEEYHRQADPQGFQGRYLRADGRPADRQEVSPARSHARGHAGHGGRFLSGFRGQQLPRRGQRRCGRASASRLSISPPENFARPSSEGPDARTRIFEELQQLRPRELLFASSLPLFESAQSKAIPAKAGFTETPLEDWVFAPDYAAPLLENHFGVLSLEGFGLAGKPAAACAAGAILHYVRQHATRLAASCRPHRLLREAELPGARRGYVRNLELVEPLFAGSSEDVTLVRASTQPSPPWDGACCGAGCCVRPSMRRRSAAVWIRSSNKPKD